MGEDEKRAIVLELFAEDVLAGLETAVGEKQKEAARFLEGLWDKYGSPLAAIRQERDRIAATLASALERLGYGR